MSQVFFRGVHKSRQVEVMAGWDPPLNRYFGTVFDLDATDDEDEVIWNTLYADYSATDYSSTERLQKQLKDMGLEAPDGFWERVHRQEADAVYTHIDGSWRRNGDDESHDLQRKSAEDLKDVPWPQCADNCAAIRYLGVGECECVCRFKFSSRG